MSSLVAKIKDIEDEMARTQINKQTMAHICGLRAKLAKYKRELLFDGPKTGTQGAGDGLREGDGRRARRPGRLPVRRQVHAAHLAHGHLLR